MPVRHITLTGSISCLCNLDSWIKELAVLFVLLSLPGRGSEGGGPEEDGPEGGPRPDEDAEAPAVGG